MKLQDLFEAKVTMKNVLTAMDIVNQEGFDPDLMHFPVSCSQSSSGITVKIDIDLDELPYSKSNKFLIKWTDKENMLKLILKYYSLGESRYAQSIINALREQNIVWPELKKIEKSIKSGK